MGFLFDITNPAGPYGFGGVKNKNMPNTYFTCGQAHRHELPDGKIWDKDSILCVIADNHNSAVEFVKKNFGYVWGSDYGEAQINDLLDYCKNGIVHTYDITDNLLTNKRGAYNTIAALLKKIVLCPPSS